MTDHTLNRRTFLKAGALGGVTGSPPVDRTPEAPAQGGSRSSILAAVRSGGRVGHHACRSAWPLAQRPPVPSPRSTSPASPRSTGRARRFARCSRRTLMRWRLLPSATPSVSRARARPAARRADPAQRQHRHRGPHDDHRRIAGARGLNPREGLVRGRTAPRGRRSPARQDEHERVGQLPLHALDERLERARRARKESVRARPEHVGIELGVRRRRCGELCRRRDRHRDRRIDRVAGEQHAVSSESSPPLVSSAARASSRLRTRKTPRGRWPARWPTPPRC